MDPSDPPAEAYQVGVGPNATLLALIDRDARIAYVSEAARDLLGYEPRELIHRRAGELIPRTLQDGAVDAFARARGGEAHVGQWTLLRRNDGRHVHVRIDAQPVTDAEGRVEFVAAIMVELGATLPRVRARDRTDAAERELISRVPAVIYVAEPGERGRWHYVSAQVEEMLGFAPGEWTADPGLWASRLHPDDRPRVLEEEARDAEQTGQVSTEYRMVDREGQIIWVRDEAVVRVNPDGSRHYDGLLIDITEHKRFESQLQFLAEHDPLTGLGNRRRFMSELDAEIRRTRRFREPASLLMIDLDDLKEVNDAHGHQAGDALLCVVAEALTGRLRDSDTVARLGGDEFGVLLRGADVGRATAVAEELIRSISAQARMIAGGLPTTGVSVGVAEVSADARSAEDALAAADRAMYEAKRHGGGAVVSAVTQARPG